MSGWGSEINVFGHNIQTRGNLPRKVFECYRSVWYGII